MDGFGLKNKVAVVTGAKQGIGEGIALFLAQCGANVVVSDLEQKSAEKTAAAITRKTGTSLLGMACDVSRKKDVDALAKAAVLEFGRMDAWVNNAGIYPFRPFLQMAESDWNKVMDVNLKGTFLGTQAAARAMKKGSIVNIASVAALIGFSGLTHYCASKGGVVAFTRTAALELAPNIRVNAIAPGAIETPGVGSLDKKTRQGLESTIPAKRIGKPQDIAHAAAYLCGDASAYVTGQVLVVDGGMTIH
ncbi:MAG: SDR family NAD(P)-dependent oxidoreductase [Candidatus Micrarchaeota archaeon]|nr:SDR family NAD(P)-dependent oxidoreductase [Candidatus Micrarchaeota archaeon]